MPNWPEMQVQLEKNEAGKLSAKDIADVKTINEKLAGNQWTDQNLQKIFEDFSNQKDDALNKADFAEKNNMLLPVLEAYGRISDRVRFVDYKPEEIALKTSLDRIFADSTAKSNDVFFTKLNSSLATSSLATLKNLLSKDDFLKSKIDQRIQVISPNGYGVDKNMYNSLSLLLMESDKTWKIDFKSTYSEWGPDKKYNAPTIPMDVWNNNVINQSAIDSINNSLDTQFKGLLDGTMELTWPINVVGMASALPNPNGNQALAEKRTQNAKVILDAWIKNNKLENVLVKTETRLQDPNLFDPTKDNDAYRKNPFFTDFHGVKFEFPFKERQVSDSLKFPSVDVRLIQDKKILAGQWNSVGSWLAVLDTQWTATEYMSKNFSIAGNVFSANKQSWWKYKEGVLPQDIVPESALAQWTAMNSNHANQYRNEYLGQSSSMDKIIITLEDEQIQKLQTLTGWNFIKAEKMDFSKVKFSDMMDVYANKQKELFDDYMTKIIHNDTDRIPLDIYKLNTSPVTYYVQLADQIQTSAQLKSSTDKDFLTKYLNNAVTAVVNKQKYEWAKKENII